MVYCSFWKKKKKEKKHYNNKEQTVISNVTKIMFSGKEQNPWLKTILPSKPWIMWLVTDPGLSVFFYFAVLGERNLNWTKTEAPIFLSKLLIQALVLAALYFIIYFYNICYLDSKFY